MRIISGIYGRRRFDVPSTFSARPTTDFAKENIFNVISNHIDFEGVDALDLFAGTGQLGIEALSRGAAHCDFVEHNKTAYGIVSKNVESARVKDKAALHRTEAAEFVSKAGRERYDVIFHDPPYGGVILENALKQIETFDILSVNGIIICESAVEDRFSHGFAVVRERRYGATMITILQRQSGETE